MHGSRIGDRYRIEAPLAEGGMGRVWLAEDERTGTIRVIKQVRTPSDLRLRRMFARELRTVARFQHPRIVQVRDVGREFDGALWYAMDRVEGETLDAWSQSPRSWSEVAQVIDDMLAALAHAHAHDVLHLDVKPENVIIDARGRAALVDFGVSRLFDPSIAVLEGVGPRPLRPLPGTPAWMAPEQIRGDEHLIGPATDLYAVGCILVELVTGRHPWPASTPEGWMLRHLTAPMPSLATRAGRPLPGPLVRIIRDLLERHARGRASNAARIRRRLAVVPSFELDGGVGSTSRGLSVGDTLDQHVPRPKPGVQPPDRGSDERLMVETLEGPTPFATTLESTLVHLRPTPLIGHEPLAFSIESALSRAIETDAGSVHVVQGSRSGGARNLVLHVARTIAEAGVARRVHARPVVRFGVQGSRLRAGFGRVIGFRSPPGPRIGAWLTDRLGAADGREVQPLVDWLDRKLPPGTPNDQADSTHAALALRVLQVLTLDEPMLLVIDDAERVEDPVDLAILRALASAEDAPRVHVLLATPSLEDLHPVLAEVLEAPVGRVALTTWDVPALCRDEAIEVCQTLLPMGDHAAESFARHIGGAPVALHRAVVDAVDEQVLVERGDQWHLADPDADEWLRTHGRRRANERIDRFLAAATNDAQTTRDVLALVALLEDAATDGTIGCVIAQRRGKAAAARVADALDAAVRRGVLVETEDGGVAFDQAGAARHALHDVAREDLDAWRAAAVTCLESEPERPGVDAIIAELRLALGDPDAPARVVAAAQGAWHRGHRRVAARLVDGLHASPAATSAPGAVLVDAARMHAHIGLGMTDRARIHDACERLDALAASDGGCIAAAWARDLSGRDALVHGLPSDAATALAEACDAFEAARAPAEARSARLALADAWRKLGRYEDARLLCERLLADADVEGRADDAIEVLNVLSFLSLETGQYARALELTAQTLDRVTAHTPRHLVVRTRKLRTGALLRTGRPADAVAEGRAALDLVYALGNRVEEAALHNIVGMCHFDLEQWGQARAAGLAALSISRAIDERHLRGRILNNLALACDRLGRTGEADRYFEDAIVWSVRGDDRQNESRTLYNMARRFADRDPGIAGALAWRSVRLLREMGLSYADEVNAWLEALDDDGSPATRDAMVQVLYRAWGASVDTPSTPKPDRAG